MSILHTVSRSTYQNGALLSCLRVAQTDCAVLLMEDGVYAALSAGHSSALLVDAAQQIQFYALEADLQARGITGSEILERVQVVDYRGFVALACEFDKVLAWF